MNIPACVHHLILLVWLSFLFFVGLWNYKNGFLLTRTVTENVSSCEDFPFSELAKPWLSEFPLNNKTVNKQCWLPGKFEKSVVLLIDGLRFDFAYSQKSVHDDIKPYRHKMNIFKDSVLRHPKNSFLAPFIADPPTTTLQRLQGLTTGTLPTFIDASSNFNGESMLEDNLVNQAFLLGKRVVFLGDDTWSSLFPKKFHRSFFYPSFNVKDLHTVDNGILSHLYDEIDKDDWDIIVAHFLGVDHCGHRFGPDHPEMASKLSQMNSVVRNVTRALPQNTVLFALGDHGMTSSGDHGGDSPSEVSSTLFIYSQEALQIDSNNLNHLVPVPQVNFVPTFSLLLGLPIPFSSLGTVLPQLFTSKPKGNDRSSGKHSFGDELFSTLAVMVNALQVRRYLQTLPVMELSALEAKWNRAQTIQNEIERTQKFTASLDTLRNLKTSYLDYLNTAREICSEKWAKFDLLSMCLGCSFVTAAVAVLAALIYRSSNNELNIAKFVVCLFKSALFVLPVSVLPYCVGYSFTGEFSLDLCSAAAVSTISAALLTLLSKTNGNEQIENNSILDGANLETFFGFLCLFLHFCVYFSNSFVVQEDTVATYLVQTLFVVFILTKFTESVQLKIKPSKPMQRLGLLFDLKFLIMLPLLSLLLLTLLRMGHLFRKCREEHGPSCENFLLITALRSLPEDWRTYRNTRIFLALVAIAVITAVFLRLMKIGRKFFRYDLTALFVNYALPFVIICIAADWIMSLAPRRTLDKLLPKKQEVPAQTAALICCLIITVVSVLPVTITRDPGSSHPRWFCFHMTLVVNQGLVLASAISLCFLLLGDGLTFSLMSIIIVATIWLGFFAAFRSRNKDYGTLRLVNFACILSALSSHGFFSTGHQPVFSAIHWNAPFVISSGESIGRFLPALIITWETFCTQVLMVLLLHSVVSVSELYRSAEGTIGSLMTENLTSSSVRGILPSLNKRSNNPNVGYLSRFENSLLTLQLSYLFCQALKLLGAVLSSFILRRHLMVWKIFAPRLVFEAVSFAVTSVVIISANLLTMRLVIKLDGR